MMSPGSPVTPALRPYACRKFLGQRIGAAVHHRVTEIHACCFDLDEYLVGTWAGPVQLFQVEDLWPPETLKNNCSHLHGVHSGLSGSVEWVGVKPHPGAVHEAKVDAPARRGLTMLRRTRNGWNGSTVGNWTAVGCSSKSVTFCRLVSLKSPAGQLACLL